MIFKVTNIANQYLGYVIWEFQCPNCKQTHKIHRCIFDQAQRLAFIERLKTAAAKEDAATLMALKYDKLL